MSTFREKLAANKTDIASPQSIDDVHVVHHKHSEADEPNGEAGNHTWNDYSLRPQEVRENATDGTLWATHTSILGTGQEFTVTNGLHSTGADHIDCFNSALQGLGHIKQGPSWASDPASGVARATIADCGCNGPCTCNLSDLSPQTQGAGDTFRERQSRRVGRQI